MASKGVTATATAETAASPTPEAEPRKRPASTDPDNEKVPAKKARTKAKSYATSEIVTVIVGPEERRFHVHESLLSDESDKLTKMITQPMEGCLKELKLPDEPIAAFEVLVDYFYHADFASDAMWEPTTTLDSFVHAWILADRLGMEDAKNSVMDRLRFTVDMANTHELEGMSDAKLVRDAVAVLQSTEAKPRRQSPLYIFLISRLARDLSKVALFGSSPVANALREPSFQSTLRHGGDIVVDLFSECFSAKSITKIGPQPDPASLKGCHFHEHTPGRASRMCTTASIPHSTTVTTAVREPKLEPSVSTTYTGPTLFSSQPSTSSFGFGGYAAPRSANAFTASPSIFTPLFRADDASTTSSVSPTQATQAQLFSSLNANAKTLASFGAGPKP